MGSSYPQPWQTSQLDVEARIVPRRKAHDVFVRPHMRASLARVESIIRAGLQKRVGTAPLGRLGRGLSGD